MEISAFDLFSIGIGPSSSHTVGPMRAAYDFLKHHSPTELSHITKITARLHGSLAFTGIGHGTNKAILMGFCGELPESIDPFTIDQRVEEICQQKKNNLMGIHEIHFDNEKNIIFDYEKLLPHHSNGMTFISYNASDIIHEAIYYSVGGGFIISETQLKNPAEIVSHTLPYPFNSAAELLAHCKTLNCSIAELMMKNELSWRDEKTIKQKLITIAHVMSECIHNGCITHETLLPGGLKVKRRAPKLYDKLKNAGDATLHGTLLMEWLDLYAIAVNEENAAGHRVVTAPTNGAAGIIPAVLEYLKQFYLHHTDSKETEHKICDFLLTAAAIGILYKKNASISGAEMGCQGEVGVACSMAAAALTAVLGGSIYQVENAAEIGMEHNLGLTCDPVKGLVQIPCIERNAMGAVKAVNAARLALLGDGQHYVSLDKVIATMKRTGADMNEIYKETSLGGLDVNRVEC